MDKEVFGLKEFLKVLDTNATPALALAEIKDMLKELEKRKRQKGGFSPERLDDIKKKCLICGDKVRRDKFYVRAPSGALKCYDCVEGGRNE